VSSSAALLSIIAQAGSADRAWTMFHDAGLDRVENDPATLSLRARLLTDRARRAEGAERHLLLHEASRAYARVGEIAADLAGKYAWQADACGAGGGEFDAGMHPLIQERILRGQIEADPHDMELKTAWIALQRILALEDAGAGRAERAMCRLTRASNALNEMLNFDPSNETWVQQRERLDADIAKFAPQRKD
jgi:hypothetical protein